MEKTAVSDREKSSAWPVFVALGLVLGEVGVVLGLYPFAVGGLLLFAGSVAGIVHEAGYTRHPWRLLGALGAVLVLLGAAVVASQLPAQTADAWAGALAADDQIVVRGFAIAAAGVVAVVASGAGAVVDADVVFASRR